MSGTHRQAMRDMRHAVVDARRSTGVVVGGSESVLAEMRSELVAPSKDRTGPALPDKDAMMRARLERERRQMSRRMREAPSTTIAAFRRTAARAIRNHADAGSIDLARRRTIEIENHDAKSPRIQHVLDGTKRREAIDWTTPREHARDRHRPRVHNRDRARSEDRPTRQIHPRESRRRSEPGRASFFRKKLLRRSP